MTLHTLPVRLEELIASLDMAPGYVMGVYHAGQQITVAVGTANLATRSRMNGRTLWQAGSITKVMTTTLLLKLVEQGLLRLDDPVLTHVPELRLSADDGQIEQLTVEMLLNHTNGIDADSLFPSTDTGPGATASYVAALERHPTLFAPGRDVSYSNPGFAVAGRIIEKLFGAPFNDVLERQLFAPLGMSSSVTSAGAAIVRSTAVGSFRERAGRYRPTDLFMLPPSGAAVGTTAIVTCEDLLRFGQMHLADGANYLPPALSRAMRTPTGEAPSPGIPAFGLGWMLSPVNADTTAVWHSGASPGGSSQLVLLPEHDLAIAGFANAAGSAPLHDALTTLVVKDLLGVSFAEPAPMSPGSDLTRLVGSYAGSDVCHRVSISEDADTLELETTPVPLDKPHEAMMRSFMGDRLPDAVELRPYWHDVLAPAGMEPSRLSGLLGRTEFVSFHGAGARPTHMMRSQRRINRVDV